MSSCWMTCPWHPLVLRGAATMERRRDVSERSKLPGVNSERMSEFWTLPGSEALLVGQNPVFSDQRASAQVDIPGKIKRCLFVKNKKTQGVNNVGALESGWLTLFGCWRPNCHPCRAPGAPQLFWCWCAQSTTSWCLSTKDAARFQTFSLQ